MTVAVVDSGVDDGVPALADRVLTGADLRSGTADGNVDCLGSGTALAGIVAGRSDDQGRTAGVAPDATILPLRIADTKASARPEDAATAIEVAVSAGAKVVTLGRLVDPRHPMVAAAVESAGRHDVVVVVSAPPAGADRGDVAPAEPVGVLTVGGVGAQNELTAAYAPNAVTVTAPGTNASSLGGGATAGSGTEYAAAFVAGVVALVRSSHPHLNAIQVVKRIASTADRMSATTPDPKYGWGMVNPAAAVTQVIAGEPTLESGGKNNGLLLIMLVGIGATVVLVTGLWRLVRRKRKDGEVTVEGPPIEDSFPKGSRESQGEAGGSMDSSR
ncbi:S8 family serine peptidase [Micromonospora chokoriensis]